MKISHFTIEWVEQKRAQSIFIIEFSTPSLSQRSLFFVSLDRTLLPVETQSRILLPFPSVFDSETPTIYLCWSPLFVIVPHRGSQTYTDRLYWDTTSVRRYIIPNTVVVPLLLLTPLWVWIGVLTGTVLWVSLPKHITILVETIFQYNTYRYIKVVNPIRTNQSYQNNLYHLRTVFSSLQIENEFESYRKDFNNLGVSYCFDLRFKGVTYL